MTSTIITEGQSLVDVAIQELGTVEALFDLADASGLGVTDLLSPSQVLQVPVSSAAVANVVNYFASRRQRINTGDEVAESLPRLHDFDYPDFNNLDWETN